MKESDIFLDEIKNMENDKAIVHIFRVLDNCPNEKFFEELFKNLLLEDFNEDLDVGFLSATILMKENKNRIKYSIIVSDKLMHKYECSKTVDDIMKGLI